MTGGGTQKNDREVILFRSRVGRTKGGRLNSSRGERASFGGARIEGEKERKKGPIETFN